MASRVQNGAVFKGILLFAGEDELLLFRKGALYSGADSTALRKICVLPGSRVQRLAARFRLTQRLLRMEPRFAVKIGTRRYLVSWRGGLYLLDTAADVFRLLYAYREGMNNPLSASRISSVAGLPDGVVFGDYWGNLRMEETGIYFCDGEKVRKVFAFAAGQVRHIHGVCPDEKNRRILICTGDSDAESGIWEAKDSFRDVRPLLVGDQRYRTCAAYPIGDGVLYATDTPLCDNYIYHYNEAEKKLTALYPLNGPCIFSRRFCDENGRQTYLFATSVEPDSRRKGWRYVLSSRLGKGVHSRHATVVCGTPEDGFREIIRQKKDLWPMVPFQFGIFRLPETENGTICLAGQSVSKLDGKTLWIKTK